MSGVPAASERDASATLVVCRTDIAGRDLLSVT